MSTTFAAIGVPDDFVALLDRRGITAPFPIQAATIPDAIAGRDVSGKAPTGSGKTLAFGIPLVARVGKANARKPRALVLVPTRELASQVANELKPLAGLRGRTVAAFYGGTGYGPQVSALRSGCEIVVACPGRLEDLLQQGSLSLEEVDIVVVDEADRMADMGFLPAVRRLLDQVSPDRQTLLFSATLDGDIDDLVRRYQRNALRHEHIDAEGDSGDVTHRFWKVSRDERLGVTAALVQRDWPAVIFCRTRHGADRVARQLGTFGVATAAIHGSRTQAQRERALHAFTSGKVQALVATDVAARGIHVDDVACVVHFDPPADMKDYVHRSGRTGRAGADGLVVTTVCPEVVGAVKSLQRELGYELGFTEPDVKALTERPETVTFRPTPDAPERPRDTKPRGAPQRDGRPRSAKPRDAKPWDKSPRRDDRRDDTIASDRPRTAGPKSKARDASPGGPKPAAGKRTATGRGSWGDEAKVADWRPSAKPSRPGAKPGGSQSRYATVDSSPRRSDERSTTTSWSKPKPAGASAGAKPSSKPLPRGAKPGAPSRGKGAAPAAGSRRRPRPR